MIHFSEANKKIVKRVSAILVGILTIIYMTIPVMAIINEFAVNNSDNENEVENTTIVEDCLPAITTTAVTTTVTTTTTKVTTTTTTVVTTTTTTTIEEEEVVEESYEESSYDEEDDSDTYYEDDYESEETEQYQNNDNTVTGSYDAVCQGTYYCGSYGSYGKWYQYVGDLQSGYSVASNDYPPGTILYVESATCPSLNGYKQVADQGGMGYGVVDFFYFYGETPSDFAVTGRVFDLTVKVVEMGEWPGW